ncbi:MAG: hypothetical protein JO212_19845 [Acetobacteraceae bacterium]|nr:hypothetical protein [Acetobacteraceae bacterium]MBV8592276.1 hypothetical protein [Acetobacteraceae bacterium]
MTQRPPCRFRRHDLKGGACIIEILRGSRIIGVIRRGGFGKPFGFAKPEVFRSLSATIDDDLGQCLKRARRH